VSQQNVNIPTGTLYGPHQSFTVQANGQLTSAAALKGSREIGFTILSITISLAAVFIPKGFLPSEDRGQINAFTEAAQGTSFESMKSQQQAVAAVVQQDKNVDSFMSSVGATGTRGSNTGVLLIRLRPRAERMLPVDHVIQQLNRKVAGIPSLQGLSLLLAVAILLIYLVLGILYESFIHPLTILSALPPFFLLDRVGAFF